MANGAAAQQKKSGCGTYIAWGCLGTLAVGILVAVGGYFAIKGFVGKLVNEYTEPTAAVLPSVEVTDEEAKAVIERMEAFQKSLQGGQPTALTLTARDINILIQKSPSWKEMAGKVYVEIEGDRIRGQASIPLSEVGSMLKGRYLNGTAVFRLELAAGRLLVFLDSLEVKGKPLPESFMKEFRAKNLAEDTNRNPNVTPVLEKLQSIEVRDGTLRVVPKAAP